MVQSEDNGDLFFKTLHTSMEDQAIADAMALPNTIYSDKMIKYRCSGKNPMIEPFLDRLVNKDPKTGEKLVSYGLSSYGYDLRIGDEYMVLEQNTRKNAIISGISFLALALVLLVFNQQYLALSSLVVAVILIVARRELVLDPKNFPADKFKRKKAVDGKIIVPPHSTILAHSMEYFRIPDDTSGICVGKSTFARCGLSCLNTPVEAGWEGYLTLEFSNGTNMPIVMYAGEGALQLVLFKGPKAEVNYRDRKGKYMHQPAQVVTPTV